MSDSIIEAQKDPVQAEEAAPVKPRTPGTSLPPPSPRQGPRGFFIWAIVVLLCFAGPLYRLALFAIRSDVYSHVLLIPFISGYLLWWNRRNLRFEFRSSPGLALVSFLAAAGVLAGWYFFRSSAGILGTGTALQINLLALSTWACLLFLVSGAFLFLGTTFLRSAALPVFLLVFAAPLPTALITPQTAAIPAGGWIVSALQYASADLAYWMLQLSGMPILKNGTLFVMPGFSINIAPACAGHHSTLVLFIVSFIAGYMLLGSRWSRAALVIAVIPLALLRNGFRIFTISQLCVQVNPKMIDSPIHHHGGPIFFALSLIPFFLFLLWLRRIERKTKTKP